MKINYEKMWLNITNVNIIGTKIIKKCIDEQIWENRIDLIKKEKNEIITKKNIYCVIEKIISGGGGAISSQTIRKRLNDLPEDEKEILINLFVRLDVDEIEFEKRINKNKNTFDKFKIKM